MQAKEKASERKEAEAAEVNEKERLRREPRTVAHTARTLDHDTLNANRSIECLASVHKKLKENKTNKVAAAETRNVDAGQVAPPRRGMPVLARGR
jgi:hypothetical protein